MIYVIQIQSPKVETIVSMQDATLQYGILGILATLLTYFAYHQFKRLTEKNEKLEEKVDKLQKDMLQLIVEEKDRLAVLVNENTKALNDLRSTIIKYLLDSE